MKLWLISQDVNNDYDTHDSAVVVAADETSARRISADGYRIWKDDGGWVRRDTGEPSPDFASGTWATPDNVSAKLVGDAAEGLSEGDVICASFNAG